ncbi:MAG TPA: 4-hydroxythreonine-4-phosphate dehydrogenase PdxA [Desulfobacteraceae bacterium]|mgnify:CR=1 FL=1|nr:4-hydroxythreonine-4-phosphate dehydrogenase PdxA [Desulfobacteraceae bacterium]HPJ67969.1 4-hydroxythreonine-4-phosphate dehydrogenase PdxA [Desulfobacteraceae bacterium]HPQ28285.1 4-hydroxythreonine-4-phosphate dehydrogenase PdxA [Desulfobacteraceae bacterium]
MPDIPLIGITMGDPAGIGPEIIVKALADKSIYGYCKPVVFGDVEILSSAITSNSSNLLLNIISDPSDARASYGNIDMLPLSSLNCSTILPGKPALEGGKAMVKYITNCVEMNLNGQLEAMVTCPISKVLMHSAGYHYDGHTQLISHLTQTNSYVMMLAGNKLRVSLVTIHCALKDVPHILNTDIIFNTIVITSKALRQDFGFKKPRLAVAALNPHAGESGLFGSEENDLILPAVKKALNAGLNVSGPYAPDTVFVRAASGEFDAVISMYHDQGLIPLKLLHFSDAVNVTLGLPIIRTSVDHGTAYDIAGKGKADASSLKAAIKLAAVMSENRKKASR